MRRRRLLTAVGAGLCGATAGCTGPAGESTPAFRVATPAFEDGDTLPVRFTCDGAGDSPPVAVERVPAPTAALAVVAKADASAITNPTFWSLWNVPPDADPIPAGLPRQPTVAALDGARQGRREGEPPGYKPPCPPAGSSVRHRFDVYALDATLSVAGGATHETAVEAIEAAELASRRVTVTYAGRG